MSWGTTRRRVTARAVLGAVAVALAACAGLPGGGAQSPAQEPAANETKDRITASDETEASKRARVRIELAGAYFGRGQMATALDEIKLAIVADPTNPAAFNLRGLIYGNLGDDKLAEESFRRALQLDARDADTMQNYGWFLCQQKRFPEAESLFRQALAMPNYRDSPRTLLTQGICQARAGQWSQAEGTLTRSYELDPGNPSTAINLAEVLYHRGELERARFQIRRINGNPDIVNAQTLWLAARIENRLGNRQGVQDFGSQLRARFPQSPEAGAFARGQFDE